MRLPRAVGALPDPVLMVLYRAWRAWMVRRHGEPPECEQCGGDAHLVIEPYGVYLCGGCPPPVEPGAGTVREAEPARDWGTRDR